MANQRGGGCVQESKGRGMRPKIQGEGDASKDPRGGGCEI